MNDLVYIQGKDALTSSRSVAEVFSKRHDNVMRDIQSLTSDLKSEGAKMFDLGSYVDTQGKRRPEYIMNRDGFTLLAMGFTGTKALEWKVKYIQAFNFMEERIKQPAELSRLQILEIAMEAEKENQKLLKEVATLQPKAEFADRVAKTDELVSISEAAKVLGLPFGRNTFFKKLREDGILFRSKNEPKQTYVARGYFKLKERFIERENHEGFVVMTTYVTQKGLLWLSKMYPGTPGGFPIQYETAS